MFWLTELRGATDPVCGMKVDRDKALINEFAGDTFFFCSNHCLHAFEMTPNAYTRGSARAEHRHAAPLHH
jgi:YHS domain-containing protein